MLTVFHVYVEVRSGFDVFAFVVGNDVGMPEALEDGKLRLQLLSFSLGHLRVADFLAAEDLGLGVSSLGFGNGGLRKRAGLRVRPTCGGPCE